MLNHLVIQELIEAGVEITFKKTPVEFSGANKRFEAENVTLVGAIEGFYKSNYVWLCIINDELHCIARYGEDEGVVNSIDDLARINFTWWEYSSDRGGGWEDPEDFWLPHLTRLGFVKTKQVFIPKHGD